MWQEDPAADEELPSPGGGTVQRALLTRIGVFLTVAHLVPKCLLVACELPPKRGVSSEPCAELVPSVFCVEALAILVIRAIFHFRSEGISITVSSY